MVMAPARIKEQVSGGEVEPQEDSQAAVEFVENATGRRIRSQMKVDHAKIQSGRVAVHGQPVESYINAVQDAFRDHQFDVIAGPGYTKSGGRVYRAINLLIKPGLSDLEKAILGGSIPSVVPRRVKIVYKEWDVLIPQAASHKRVTHNSHRLKYGENPNKRIS